MEIRPYRDSDDETCGPWFPAEGSPAFMDVRWLASASREARYEPDNHSLFVGCQDGEAVSVFSVSRTSDGDRAIVSLLVAPHLRRSGIARATMQALRDEFPEVNEVVAYVDPNNVASVKLLEGLGLVAGPSDKEGRLLFVWRRDG